VAQINSISALCVTKLDVLDGLEKIRICIDYANEAPWQVPSYDADTLAHCKPIYEDLPGWQSSTFGITDYEKLPANAKHYLKRLEECVGVPITMISTGPERDQMIVLQHPLR
jgi:adenylosuccinate synthase